MKLNEYDIEALEKISALLNCLDASESYKELNRIIRKLKRVN